MLRPTMKDAAAATIVRVTSAAISSGSLMAVSISPARRAGARSWKGAIASSRAPSKATRRAGLTANPAWSYGPRDEATSSGLLWLDRLAALRWRKEAANLGCEVPHLVRELVALLARVEELIGDLHRGENRRLLRLDHRTALEDRSNRPIDILRNRARELGRALRPDRVLLADDRDANGPLDAHFSVLVACCRTKWTRSSSCRVRVLAASRRSRSSAFSRCSAAVADGSPPVTDSISLTLASALSARRRNDASSSSRCRTSCASS